MKKIAKRLSLQTQTIRLLQSDDLSQVPGGSGTTIPTSIIRPSGTSVIAPGTVVQTGTSIISAGGGH